MFKNFRQKNDYKNLIAFLTATYPRNVKNKTFNFINTDHLFHSLYAYIPAITNVEKERKQIRLSEECIHKLFLSTVNDFKMYSELFEMIRSPENVIADVVCPCQLLVKRRDEIVTYANLIEQKKFDTKPPKLKKEPIDAVMHKYSLNWKNLILKKKFNQKGDGMKSGVKKRKIKKRAILTDEPIRFNVDNDKLFAINGMSLTVCKHKFVTVEKQLRAGDEVVSFIKCCELCGRVEI